ncbi:MAG: phosphonopyruvate decarboxylase [Bdellovibrionales bacterium RIFOXYD12_FULL_39_22]|nr:MAG: phosphonopyruvate decarboxylase [Bdellovibrionales bacterium RIFOXYB1_FULL_39_21]OFZ40907.1 MAG: phosphonopyruvate decarboxylase [Bdellovibrionales bacterium RIFOXYC12_FULL_39_17]OFZ44749.1 MAG: phosphonopyruvate decarboxylase [Bdellovibrionales bacterium RIFOXYC1_FULL_39_130]OFZ73528.1 MAG: phosphonopyruvate decarboxylase [Bdellovibrionales bacterium RIFOXYC2_FULL_39_8]OFZ74200.1 MAG: phosphonopyruvate decarboxylase [Bdellovibrionales bacterium RIFOXYD1_FULL_39_84]OFZ92080.1 MAG: phos
MNKVEDFYKLLREHNIDFFAGVPDSFLQNFCAYISNNVDSKMHLTAANEGGAIALAVGHHLATGKIPLVYMQNSGLGNAVNPLLSLADPEVYSIPMVLLIGWRGRPGEKDEPQHVKQGRVQNALLEAMEIKYQILGNNYQESVNDLINYAKESKRPVAFICPKDFWEKEQYPKANAGYDYKLPRETAIEKIALACKDSLIVSTTGKASRELFEIRKKYNLPHNSDFLTVGSMGHCSQIALGLAKFTSKNVVCLDGDGALIMHLGALPIIGSQSPENLLHILLNNGAHESVGGQATVAFSYDFSKVAANFGYKNFALVDNEDDLISTLNKMKHSPGPNFIEVRLSTHSRKDLGRPTETPINNKNSFMELVKKNDKHK